LSGGAEWKLREDEKRSSTFFEMLAGRLELTIWIAASTSKHPLWPAVRSFRQKTRLRKRSSPFPDRQEIGVETLMGVRDNTGIIGVIRTVGTVS
jgi:hypothetical protein